MASSRIRTLVLFVLVLLVATSHADPIQFESHQVHPLAIRGDQVLAVNTPDARLSVFSVATGSPVLVKEIRVGLEPVSVALRDAQTAWVVNHLSDDISIVDLDRGVVVHTLVVGDEPADVVLVDHPVLDDGSMWAVISLSQEDRVVIHEAQPPYTRVESIDIDGSDPRALYASPDQSSVWVAVFESGSRTTMAPRDLVKNASGPYGGQLPPYDPPVTGEIPVNLLPDNGIILANRGGVWVDEMGGDWSGLITWNTYDNDLVRIDLGLSPGVGQSIQGVGTLIEDLTIDAATGDVWAISIESFNDILFQPKLSGGFARNIISRIAGGFGTPETFELNTHIPVVPKTQQQRATVSLRQESLAIPTEILFSDVAGSAEIYVSAIGGERVAVIDPFDGSVTRRLVVPRGASGLVADEQNGKLLLLNRLSNTLHVIDPVAGDTGQSVPIGASGWDPTPQSIKAGREFLYTGVQSAKGDLACATCHPYANMDNIGWDLGDPSSAEFSLLDPAENFGITVAPFFAFKGPMTTQSLRGLKDTGRLHWRGDRADFIAFNGAFSSLLGGNDLSGADMTLFEQFILSIAYPPNPLRDLRDGPSVFEGGDPFAGEAVFNNNDFCTGCHAMPLGTNTAVVPIENLQGFGNQPQKIPHLRNLYEKTGFDDENGPNKRAFGFLHDGMDKNLAEFVAEPIFGLNAQDQVDLKAFLMNFPTGTHPATGAQISLAPSIAKTAQTDGRLGDILAAEQAGILDVIATGQVDGEIRGFVLMAIGWHGDRLGDIRSTGELLAAAATTGNVLTFMAVPKGEGIRMGIDRDMDGAFDSDELDKGSDPADPSLTPTSTPGARGGASLLSRVTRIFPAPFAAKTTVEVYLPHESHVDLVVYDLRGRRVARLASGRLPAGSHIFPWNGRDDAGHETATGSYLIQLRTPEHRHVRKVVRMK